MSRRRKKRLSFFRLFLLLTSLLVLFMMAGGAGAVIYSLKDLPSFDPQKLSGNSSTLLYDSQGKLIAEVGTQYRIPVKLGEIPLEVQNAFLAVEDARFYEHIGIDFRGILRALWNNLTKKGIYEGGSTITQQLARNCFLSQERTWKRKIQEAILALAIERHYRKQEILEFYLNHVYFGAGAYGIQAAARTYFNKDVSQLTLEEGALLAGLVQAPSAYSPFENPKAALERRNMVLDAMVRWGFLDPARAQALKEKPLKLNPGTTGSGVPGAYFVDYVTEQLVAKYGADRVFREGLRVYTTLDSRIQEIAERVLNDPQNFPPSVRDEQGVLQPQAAVVIIDPQTGSILALVGGRGQPLVRQGFNRAVHARRQPGSAFKPLIAYAPAIEYLGYAPATVFDDIPVRFGSYEPRNYDGRYRGLITLRTALTYSVNTVAVQLLDKVGMDKATEFVSRLGIKIDPRREKLGIALGGLDEGVTPLQMAQAYAALANQGRLVPATAILRVETRAGAVLEEHRLQPVQVMKPTTAYLVTDMLRSAVERGTGQNARLGKWPVAGKTGTTDANRDAWFCGYTPQLVGVVWMGYDTPQTMKGEYGGGRPALIWRKIMAEALRDTPPRDFPRPPGIVTATVDGKSGLLPGPLTPPEDLVTDIFAEGTVPSRVDDTRVLVELCATTGLLATEYCPEKVTNVLIKCPYQVPSFVEDYHLRVPSATCNLHQQPTTPPPEKATPDEEGSVDHAGRKDRRPPLRFSPAPGTGLAGKVPRGD
ncbi:penicillin-binding protein, 1A family [Ammonifex degensii KC4]|uniref:Penicillin-binding protein 1A n=1 Tax=Ammonifex degensii (strain DSM 10501 / KC4) TaxID=429009 RepID=C9R909_AMMDK|nr:penicillin-binding protein 1A [Ammonifex degensii]ACX52788.1 penicillin-binding protein, 1A family [Ammonifex degensii KC4]